MDRAIISAMLDYPNKQKYLIGEIRPEEFKSDMCRELFQMIKEVRKETGIDCDTVLLYKKAFQKKKSYASSILDFQSQTPSVAHVSAYLMAFKQDVKRNLLKRNVNWLMKIAPNALEDDECFEELKRVCKEITLKKSNSQKEPKTAEQIRLDNVKYFRDVKTGKKKLKLIKTGWNYLDFITKGFAMQDLVILMGRSNMGKTRFAINLMINFIEKNFKYNKTCFFSIEEPESKIVNMIMANKIKINTDKFKQVTLTDKELYDYENYSLESMPLLVDDNRKGVDLEFIENKIEFLSSVYGYRIFFIDTINQIAGDSDETKRLNVVSAGLKTIARENDVLIIALAQMNRNSEAQGRKNRRPSAGDLKGSDEIFHNSDCILGVYMEDYYRHQEGKESEIDGIMEIINIKTRDGLKGVVEFNSYLEHCDFWEINKG